MTAGVAQVRTLIDEVSDASRQQSDGIGQVTQAVNQMERVTQTTAATAEESAAASEELSAQAETTMGIVAELRRCCGDGSPRSARRRRRSPCACRARRSSDSAVRGPRDGVQGPNLVAASSVVLPSV